MYINLVNKINMDIENLVKSDINDIIKRKKYIFRELDLKKLDNFVKYIVKNEPNDAKEFNKLSTKARKLYKIQPRKSQIIHYYRQLVSEKKFKFKFNEKLDNLMIKKLVRKSSGVQVITVLTSPYPSYTKNGVNKSQKFSCGHNCGYCPKETELIINQHSY